MWFDARGPLSDAERKEKQLKRIWGKVQSARMIEHSAGSGGATLFGVSVGLAISIDKINASSIDYVIVFLLATQVWMWLSHGNARRNEDLFEKLHDYVQSLPPEKIDESMDTTAFAAGMPTRLEYCRRRWIGLLHGAATAATIGLWGYLKFFVL